MRQGVWLCALALGACGAPQTVVPEGTPWIARCRPGHGLSRPLPACTPEVPCGSARVFSDGRLLRRSLTVANPEPVCRTAGPIRPFADDGAPVVWTAPGGTARFVCMHHPPGGPFGVQAPELPLVVFFHPGYGSAADLYNETSLVGRARSSDLTGDSARAGFVLAAVQARNLHWPTGYDGSHFDHYNRDLSRNPDVAFVDQVIDSTVAGGGIDPQRIYLVGWSDGGTFAEYYGIARHEHPTVGGHRVAAAGLYAVGDPYAGIDSQRPECATRPPRSTFPMVVLQRSCDAVNACGSVQRGDFGTPPGYDTETWMRTLATVLGDDQATLQLLDERGRAVDACAADCMQSVGAHNHLRWPDGISDVGGHDWEPTLLEFLRAHPLARPP